MSKPEPVWWCPECGFVFSMLDGRTICTRKRWNQGEQRFFYCPGKLVDLVKVYMWATSQGNVRLEDWMPEALEIEHAES